MEVFRWSHFGSACGEWHWRLGDDRIQKGVAAVPKRYCRRGRLLISVFVIKNRYKPVSSPESLQQSRNPCTHILIGDLLHSFPKFRPGAPVRCFGEQAVPEEHSEDANQRVCPKPAHAGELADRFRVQKNAEDHGSKHFI